MKVLVTGASGLLGGGVARALRDRGDHVTVLQRRAAGLDGVREVRADLGDTDRVRSAAAGVDVVVHLAAKVDVTGPWREYAAVNVDGTAAVVAACRATGVGRLVYVSSPSVAHAGHALVGVGAGPAAPDLARGPYARSKALAEQLALAADDPAGAGLSVLAVRPHLVWGPGDQQLVARIVARARVGRLPVIGSGAALVDTTFVDNAVDALVAAVDADEAHGEALVVSNGEPRPIAELVAAICRASGVEPPRSRIPVAPASVLGGLVEAAWTVRNRLGLPVPDQPPLTRFLVEQLSTAHWFDQRRTRAVLRWAPRTSIDEGLARLADAHPAGSRAA